MDDRNREVRARVQAKLAKHLRVHSSNVISLFELRSNRRPYSTKTILDKLIFGSVPISNEFIALSERSKDLLIDLTLELVR